MVQGTSRGTVVPEPEEAELARLAAGEGAALRAVYGEGGGGGFGGVGGAAPVDVLRGARGTWRAADYWEVLCDFYALGSEGGMWEHVSMTVHMYRDLVQSPELEADGGAGERRLWLEVVPELQRQGYHVFRWGVQQSNPERRRLSVEQH